MPLLRTFFFICLPEDVAMQRDHITGFREEIKKADTLSKEAFFTWFDGGNSVEDVFVRGAWDFATFIIQPLAPYITKCEEKTALEIGYGGGRMLAASSRYFHKVIGVDVHECKGNVAAELQKRGVHNFALYSSDGKSIPMGNDSVDVVYSFIVLQHVEKIEIFKQYIDETCRVLKSGGIAVLYFGRYCPLSIHKDSKLLYLADRVLERIKFWKGYREIKAEVNCINLLVTMPYAKKLCSSFIICQELHSFIYKSGKKFYGLQHGLVLNK